MQTRYTQHIQLGTHEDKVGFTMTFTDGAQETFLFDLATADALFRQGLQLVTTLQQERQRTAEDHVGIQEEVTLRLVP